MKEYRQGSREEMALSDVVILCYINILVQAANEEKAQEQILVCAFCIYF